MRHLSSLNFVYCFKYYAKKTKNESNIYIKKIDLF
jgi:hypothetical protein